MNPTTQNVTLYAVFLNDILNLYRDKKDQFAQPLFEMTRSYDLSDPFNKVPLDLYNQMCDWLEQELGPANLRKVGVQIGETVFEALKNSGSLPAKPQPIDLLNGLVYAAANMIQDPEGRGWEIREVKDKSIVMRRTQAFNSILQLGLLRGLVAKTEARMVEVKYLRSVAGGADYDDYLITWM
jgi:hypothetical protein